MTNTELKHHAKLQEWSARIRALLQSLVRQNEAVPFPVQALDTVSPPSTEQKQRVGKRIQFKLLLDKARQAIYAFAQICVATGNVDFICASEVVQHRRRSSTSSLSCSASQPG